MDIATLLSRASSMARRRALAARAALAAAVVFALSLAGASAAVAAEHAPRAVAAALQEQGKLTSEAGSTATAFGFTVAVSADGNTALVGTRRTHGGAGAVWVFVRTDGVWTQQGPALVGAEEAEEPEGSGCASPESEGPECSFGRSVALSADGETALIGGPNDDHGRGAAWVFARDGSTWSPQGELLGGEEPEHGHFGRSVALSSDGSTALIGGSVAPQAPGAAWVFTRSGSSWTQQGPPLAGGTGHFGRSVALSAGGNVALVGSPSDGEGQGALWFFDRNGTTWRQAGAPATAGEEDGGAGLGSSVALSADGKLALAGGSGDDDDLGAAWMFSWSPSGFVQEGPKLTGAGESAPALFGYSVALAADGAEALIGAPASEVHDGAAVSFAWTGSSWTETGPLVVPEELGKGSFGKSVALSSDGATAVVGGTSENALQGAAWTFFDPTIVPPTEEEVVKEEEETMKQEEEAIAEEEPPAGTGKTPVLPAETALVVSPFVATGELASTEIKLPPPQLGVLGNLDPVAGIVRVKLPGSKTFVDVTGLRQVPFGTIIDARDGKVVVTTVSADGQLQSMTFYQGEFRLTQNANGMVLATLVGGNFKGCPRVHARGHLAHASSAKRHVVRKLWASGHGSYTTKGNYASGAVLGTRWLTEDRCDGTLISVYTDEVAVTNLLTHKRRTVKAGHSELVKAP